MQPSLMFMGKAKSYPGFKLLKFWSIFTQSFSNIWKSVINLSITVKISSLQNDNTQKSVNRIVSRGLRFKTFCRSN